MGSDVTLGLAFVAGIISFISPCVLPLVPAYIGYMGGRVTQQIQRGSSVDAQRRTFAQRFGTLTHGVFFVLGFTLFFVIFGLLTTAAVSSLTALGASESQVRDGIARVGGTAVILFGLHVMGVLNRLFGWLLVQARRLDRNPYGNLISALVALALLGGVYWLFVGSWFFTLVAVLLFTQVFNHALKADTPGEFWARVILTLQTALYVDTRRQSQPRHQYGYLGSLLMGVVFSAGWTPCIGPIYGAVLTMASSGGSTSEAGVLLTAYSLGLGIPFLLTALALDQAQGVFRRLQRNMRTIELVSGLFLVLIGVLVFSGQLERLTQVGGSQGKLADLSFNLEDCSLAAIDGRVRWSQWTDCLDAGLKDDFYLAAGKTAALGAGPALAVPDLSASADSADDPPVTAAEGFAVGQRAPDFTAQTLDGRTVSLSDFRGAPVLVNFWATWCVPCRKEMPDFQIIYETYRDSGFQVVAVNNMEQAGTVAGFVEEYGLTFPVVLDPSGEINLGLYRTAIPGWPTSFLLDKDGVIVAYFPRSVEGAELVEALAPLLAD